MAHGMKSRPFVTSNQLLHCNWNLVAFPIITWNLSSWRPSKSTFTVHLPCHRPRESAGQPILYSCSSATRSPSWFQKHSGIPHLCWLLGDEYPWRSRNYQSRTPWDRLQPHLHEICLQRGSSGEARIVLAEEALPLFSAAWNDHARLEKVIIYLYVYLTPESYLNFKEKRLDSVRTVEIAGDGDVGLRSRTSLVSRTASVLSAWKVLALCVLRPSWRACSTSRRAAHHFYWCFGSQQSSRSWILYLQPVTW